VRADIALIGGGLANALIAWRLAQERDPPSVAIVEPDTLGGNHTWSFHETDLAPAARAWIAPLVAARWPGYTVRFPDHARRLGLAYASLTAERLRQAFADLPTGRVIRDRAVEVGASHASLESGGSIEAPLVIDGRGARDETGWGIAWQVFVGLEIETEGPHGLDLPVVMDASVAQGGDYRFVYSLPFSATRVLVEDTRYSDSRAFEKAALREGALAYARKRGWRVAAIVREEEGALPIVLSGEAPPLSHHEGPAVVGVRAGLFHPVTGYSLPDAARIADLVARTPKDTAALRPLVARIAASRWRTHAFHRLLNRMLFMAGPAETRWRMLSRFYLMPETTIARFYAGETNAADMARLLIGRPPVGIAGALAAMPPSSARGFVAQRRALGGGA